MSYLLVCFFADLSFLSFKHLKSFKWGRFFVERWAVFFDSCATLDILYSFSWPFVWKICISNHLPLYRLRLANMNRGSCAWSAAGLLETSYSLPLRGSLHHNRLDGIMLDFLHGFVPRHFHQRHEPKKVQLSMSHISVTCFSASEAAICGIIMALYTGWYENPRSCNGGVGKLQHRDCKNKDGATATIFGNSDCISGWRFQEGGWIVFG